MEWRQPVVEEMEQRNTKLVAALARHLYMHASVFVDHRVAVFADHDGKRGSFNVTSRHRR